MSAMIFVEVAIPHRKDLRLAFIPSPLLFVSEPTDGM
jgi:hypothetical protein